MIVRIDEPEQQIVLRLGQSGDAITLLAKIAGSDDVQELMRFQVEGRPTADDPLAQRNNKLVVFTRKVRHDFPVELDSHGHLEVRMKA